MTTTVRRSQNDDAATRGPRRRRNLGDRLTIGHAAPVVLAVVAGALVAAALSQTGSTTEVPVASGAIAAGAPVNASDTRLVAVHSGDTAVRAGLLPAGNLSGGWVATVSINSGDPITRSEVSHAASGTGGLGAMSLPVPIANADGGAIVAGDLVDVIATSGPNGAQYIAQGLRVISVPSASSGAGVLATASDDYYVVVAVDRATALRLATALATSNGQGSSAGIEVVRTTGELPTSPQDGS